jgi:5-methylcytosine-specific restriction protein A
MPQAAQTLSQIKNATRPKDNRPSASRRGYGTRWKKYRTFYLTSHPLCVKCDQMNIIKPATVVDHREPHKGNMAKFWDQTNHQGLCKPCHDTKTATEDGGFGHKRKVVH